MKRLTIWDIPGEIAVPWDARSSCDDTCENMNGECERCDINRCLVKLAEYEDAEEEGRLFEFPVSLYGHLWLLPYRKFTSDITEVEVNSLEITQHGDIYLHIISLDSDLAICFHENELGKMIFLTREEAEAKLKEMEADKCI